LPDQSGENATNPSQALTLGQPTGLMAGHHDRIGSRRKPFALQRKSLPEQPLYPVTLHGAADLAGD
jgi:hypothetical protein